MVPPAIPAASGRRKHLFKREYLTMTVKRITATPAFLVALTLTAPCALAGPQTKLSLDPPVTVRLEDLNTWSAAGNRVLYGRISAAAMAVCSRGGDWYPTEHWKRDDCYRATVDHAVTQLNLPLLTALHLQRMHAEPVLAGLRTRKR
jgi:UrcA family protein